MMRMRPRGLARLALSLVAAASFACHQSNEPDFPLEYKLGKGPGPAASAPESLAGDVRTEEKKDAFDEAQAKVVLRRAANSARTCINVVGPNQPHGDTVVTVTFSGTAGRSTKATVGPPFAGKPIGNCVIRAFTDIVIKPFEGPDVDVTQKVSLHGGK